jgi:hypothetical protein
MINEIINKSYEPEMIMRKPYGGDEVTGSRT